MGQAPRVAFVQSTWHAEIVDRGRESFVATMDELGFGEGQIDRFRVPGAFEIPLHARRLATSGRYAAVVAAGLVVDGGIYRHEFVAEAVVNGLMGVQLATDIPVFSVVLTPHHFHEHATHATFFAEHFATKGAEAARACVETLRSLASLEALAPAGA
jgi:6,7-dimethyl-8-ribityllumazine synthase